MASQCNCPTCHDHLGKDTECNYYAYCSNCGEHFINERGDKEYQPKDKSLWPKPVARPSFRR